MHVAHFETRALARQATGAQRRHPPFIRDLGQRVRLVHELRQLVRTEELLHCGGDRLGIDHVLRHQPLGFGERQPLLDRPFHANQAHAELVLRHFADRLDAPVAQMVDVVDRALAVADADQRSQHVDDVVVGQRTGARDPVPPEPPVEFHAPDGGQVVAFRREEQVAEQVLRRLLGGWLARTHHAVDVDQRLQAIAGDIEAQRIGDVRPAVEVVGVDRLDLLDARLDELIEQLLGHFGVAGCDDLAGLLGNDVPGEHTANQVLARHVETVGTGTFQQPHVPCGHPAARLHEDVARAIADVEGRDLAAQTLRH